MFRIFIRETISLLAGALFIIWVIGYASGALGRTPIHFYCPAQIVCPYTVIQDCIIPPGWKLARGYVTPIITLQFTQAMNEYDYVGECLYGHAPGSSGKPTELVIRSTRGIPKGYVYPAVNTYNNRWHQGLCKSARYIWACPFKFLQQSGELT